MKQNMKVFIPATLGMLTAFGPFVTDFYLPVLPEMTGYFHTTPALASMSLTAGMIGLAAGQLFIGRSPISTGASAYWLALCCSLWWRRCCAYSREIYLCLMPCACCRDLPALAA